MSSNMPGASPPTHQAGTEGFDSAIEKLTSRVKNSLTKDERDEIANVSLGDLHETIKKIQEKQRGTRTYRNLNRIEPFVTGMTAYGRVIAVFANAVPIVAFVWVGQLTRYRTRRESNFIAGPNQVSSSGGITAHAHYTDEQYILYFYNANSELKIASSYSDAFDLLLNAYKDIGDNLPQFGKYAQLFGDKLCVRKALVEVFEGILRFHRRAMGFFRRSGLCRSSSTVRSELL